MMTGNEHWNKSAFMMKNIVNEKLYKKVVESFNLKHFVRENYILFNIFKILFIKFYFFFVFLIILKLTNLPIIF